MELGPGKGSWSRAILRYIPQGELHTVDFQDVTQWLKPENYPGRLICHHVQDNSFHGLPDGYFDVFWSFGVLCHNQASSILHILTHARGKMKPGPSPFISTAIGKNLRRSAGIEGEFLKNSNRN